MPPAKRRKLWIIDANLETTRGGGPGNTNSGSVNNGDGSAQDRAAYDYSDDSSILAVALNDDDDNNDGVVDYDDGYNKDGVPGNDDDINPDEDDLVALKFQFTEGISQAKKGTVTITLPSKLKLWHRDSKDTPVTKLTYNLETEWDIFSDSVHNKTLYVEGYEASSSLHDAVLELEYDLGGKSAKDTVRYTVVDVEIKKPKRRVGGDLSDYFLTTEPYRYDNQAVVSSAPGTGPSKCVSIEGLVQPRPPFRIQSNRRPLPP